MKERVELIFDLDCPNVAAARATLQEAFARAGLPPSWAEWDHKAPHSPARVRGYGSPTVLVDGKDIAGSDAGAAADCCRVYADAENALRGVPPVEQIAAALSKAVAISTGGGSAATARFEWRGVLAALPGLGATLLPVGVCPACWPAYAGVLSSLGLGFLLETTYLLPATAALLLLALASLAYRARSRRGYGPLVVGIVASAIAVAGKFTLASNILLYVGLTALLTASIWSSWPRPTATIGSCPA